MATVHINIGSNLGDRRANLARAVALIREHCCPCGEGWRMSTVVESEPWGFVSENRFLNVGVMFESPDTPQELFSKLRRIETSLSTASHRDAAGGYADRLVDIDLVAFGDEVTDTPELILPHPRMLLRDFVLKPIAEIDPAWRHPLTGETAREALLRL